MEKTLILPDLHIPHHDKKSLHLIFKIIDDIKPERIIQLGDLFDFYQISRFNKEPKRVLEFQKDLNELDMFFYELRKIYKKDFIYIEGNHEIRLIKWLWQHPEVYSLKKINNIPSLFNLEKYSIRYFPYFTYKSVYFKHGNYVSTKSSYSAKLEYDAEGTSGVSGHTHRLGIYYVQNRNGFHTWYEMGHLTDVKKVEYLEGKIPNWQQGFGIMYVVPKTNFWRIEQIPIINHKFIYGGVKYEWNH